MNPFPLPILAVALWVSIAAPVRAGDGGAAKTQTSAEKKARRAKKDDAAAAERKKRSAEFEAQLKTERDENRKIQHEERKTLKETLKGKKPDEKKAALKDFNDRQKEKLKAFRQQQREKRRKFQEDRKAQETGR